MNLPRIVDVILHGGKKDRIRADAIEQDDTDLVRITDTRGEVHCYPQGGWEYYRVIAGAGLWPYDYDLNAFNRKYPENQVFKHSKA